MKRFLILIVLLAGGVAAAALAVPSNAAVVNGVAITQNELNADVTAIANSTGGLYGCFLNAEEVVATNAQSGTPTGLPPIDGASQPNGGARHATATTAFVGAYLDTVIGHHVVFDLAARRHLVLTTQDLTTAHTQLIDQITAIMSDVSGSQYACGTAVTGTEVLSSMTKPFVDEEVRYDATISVLEETAAGVGSSTADIEKYFNAHRSLFDSISYSVAGYSTAAAAQAAAAQVKAGTPFAQVAAQAPGGGGPQGTTILYGISQQLPAGTNLASLPLNAVSQPISLNNSYFLLEITARNPTPFATAKSEVRGAVQSAGSAQARQEIADAEGRATVTVDPRYGTWTPRTSQTIPPGPPPAQEVLNVAANSPRAAALPAATTPTPGGTPATGSAG